jgi:hypothetical protein
VGVALPRERAELEAGDVARVAGELLVASRLLLALAPGQLVELGVGHRLQAALLAEHREDLLGPERLDRLEPVQDVDLRGADLAIRERACAGLVLERIVEPVDADVDGELCPAGQVDAGAPADGVEVVERPPVEKVRVVAAVHPAACPHGEPLVPDAALLEVQVADGDLGGELARVVEERIGDGERRDHQRAGRVEIGGELPGVLAA